MFPSNIVKQSFNLMIISDNILESNEEFQLTITSKSLPDRVSFGDPSQTIVTIIDDDGELVPPFCMPIM